jgi:hypothetical protein
MSAADMTALLARQSGRSLDASVPAAIRSADRVAFTSS